MRMRISLVSRLGVPTWQPTFPLESRRSESPPEPRRSLWPVLPVDPRFTWWPLLALSSSSALWPIPPILARLAVHPSLAWLPNRALEPLWSHRTLFPLLARRPLGTRRLDQVINVRVEELLVGEELGDGIRHPRDPVADPHVLGEVHPLPAACLETPDLVRQ